MQDGRVSRNILSTSSIQRGVWDHPREVETGGWREEFGGRRARGFRRGRRCRDQLLTLMLLGQMKAISKRGMFAGFIDFRKAYDRVDREKLWGCFGKDGTGRSCICLLKAVYTGTSSEVKVGEERNKPFRVACGLRQGCILSPCCPHYTLTHWSTS